MIWMNRETGVYYILLPHFQGNAYIITLLLYYTNLSFSRSCMDAQLQQYYQPECSSATIPGRGLVQPLSAHHLYRGSATGVHCGGGGWFSLCQHITCTEVQLQGFTVTAGRGGWFSN